MSIKSKLLAVKSTYLDNESVSNREMLGYASGIFGNAMGQDSTDTFSDKFDRDFMGLSNAMLTVKGNISTILGFFIPPLAGTLYDMPSKEKRSHLRTALLTAPLPFAITSMLLFVVPSSNPAINFIWTLFFGIFFSIADTFYDIAMNTIALKMVSDPDDRKKFFTFESIASTLGSMLPGGVIPVIVGMTDDVRRRQWLYFFIALGFCIIGIISMYAPYMTIKERAAFSARDNAKSAEDEKEKIVWDKRTILSLLHNRPFVIVELAALFETIRQITYKILPYLYDDTFNDYKMKTIIDTMSGSLSYVGLMAVPYVGKKISAKAMLVGGYSYSAFFYLIASLFNINFNLDSLRKKRYIPGICIGFSGVPNAAQGAARKIIVADSTDYMEWYSEKKYGAPLRSDGLLSAARNIFGKINALLKTNLYNGMFSVIGYKIKDPLSDVKPVQSTRTLHGIYAVATICGFLGNILPAFCFLFDNFSGNRRKQIYEELYEMRRLRENKMDELTEDT